MYKKKIMLLSCTLLLSIIILRVLVCNYSFENDKVIKTQKNEVVIIKKPVEYNENIEFEPYNISLSKELQKELYNECNKKEVPFDLAICVLGVETGYTYNPNLKNKNKNGTTDLGMAMINSKYIKEAARSAGIKLENFDPFNPKHAIKACVGILRDKSLYWKKQGIENCEIWKYTCNSYNMGINGYKKYIKKYGHGDWKYYKTILIRQEQLEKFGAFKF